METKSTLSQDEYNSLVRNTTIAVIDSQSLQIENLEAKINKLDIDTLRSVLKEQLTCLQKDLSEDLNQSIDQIIQHEYKQVEDKIVSSDSLPRLFPDSKIAIWRGDITLLKIDAIVNAANKWMLGCFTPNHPCIDNQIHSRAGPRLRQECRAFMAEQKALEATGQAKITLGYNLPAKYVLHTVGPIAPEVGERADLLGSCYLECLKKAVEKGARSIAFCCISTGVFGYPQEPAAKVALTTVKKWLEENDKDMDLIVFNVWTPKDLEIYSRLAPTVFNK